MKRRLTKKMIRKAERALATTIRDYLALPPEAEQGSREEFIHRTLSVDIDILVMWHLELAPSWPSNKRWVDGVSLRSVLLAEPVTLSGRGVLWWGLTRDIGGEQWAEPFEVALQLSKRRDRLVSYRVKFSESGKGYVFSG